MTRRSTTTAGRRSGRAPDPGSGSSWVKKGAARAGADGPAVKEDRRREAVLLVPGVGWLVLFFLVPLLFILVVSVGERDRFGAVVLTSPSLGSYVRALDPGFIPTIFNSLKYAVATTILSIAIAYPMAYAISRYGGRRKALLLVLVMLPFWTSWVIRTYAWMILLRDNGVLNGVLGAFGLGPVSLLNTDVAVILGMTYGFLPFTILPLYVAIDRLDPNLVQAARDLYANGRGAFLHVTLPLTMPGVVAAAILTFIPTMGDFVTPDLLGGAQTTTIAKVIQNAFLSSRDWPFGSALGFLMIVITIVGTLAGLRFLRREVIS
jgi:spermidine/putrescine transport system permease protein